MVELLRQNSGWVFENPCKEDTTVVVSGALWALAPFPCRFGQQPWALVPPLHPQAPCRQGQCRWGRCSRPIPRLQCSSGPGSETTSFCRRFGASPEDRGLDGLLCSAGTQASLCSVCGWGDPGTRPRWGQYPKSLTWSTPVTPRVPLSISMWRGVGTDEDRAWELLACWEGLWEV